MYNIEELVTHKEKDMYNLVIKNIEDTTDTLRIATANFKDFRVMKDEKHTIAISELLNKIGKYAMIKIITSSKKSYAIEHMEGLNIRHVTCLRNHMKLIIIDNSFAYIGSANMTGAGLGIKSENSRNFEVGVITRDIRIITQLIEIFDSVFSGKYCKDCLLKRKGICAGI